MVPFVHQIDITDAHQLIQHFQAIPDITEHILESDRYPLAALNEALETLTEARNYLDQNTPEYSECLKTIIKIESVISTRIDYVNSIIETLLGKETIEPPDFSLEHSDTKEILFHIDLMKDVAHSSEIDQDGYKTALRKFIKTLKFRFNKGLEIHKKLYHLQFEDLASLEADFPQSVLEEQKVFLEDALAMTRSHVPVTLVQIQQLKETLFKILEAMGVRILQTNPVSGRAEYCKIWREVENVLVGFEVEFGQKLVKRFADMLPEYIADHWNVHVVRHNRKLVELLIDVLDDTALLEDLYQILLNLVGAELTQLRKKQELSKISLKHLQTMQYVKDDEDGELIEIEKFRGLDLPEKARELIKLSIYGLCEYVSKISVAELRKYPIGILRSIDKIVNDLQQHRLQQSDIEHIHNSPEYSLALTTVREALATYNDAEEKYNFVDLYKETDHTVEGVTYCTFNDPILRVIQNITEAYFVVDSSEQDLSEHRMAELQITIVERYKREWGRQNELQQQIEQKTMEELAGEL
jgi:hypothetical protein